MFNLKSLKSLKYLLLISTIFFLLSCNNEKKYTEKLTDGILTIYNKTKPSGNSYNITLNEILDLNNVSLPDSSLNGSFNQHSFDSQGNLFFVDFRSCIIYKIDKNGKYDKSFCRQGNGPGEISSPRAMTILNDTIYITDFQTHQMARFTNDGKFIDKLTNKFGFPIIMDSIGKDRFLGLFLSVDQKADGVYFSVDLNMVDSKFSTKKTFSSVSNKIDNPDFNFMDAIFPFAVDNRNERIYIGEVSTERYKVSVLDFEGKISKVIRKSYRKIKYSKKELKELEEWSIRNNVPFSAKLFKNAINFIQVDHRGRLWVNPSVETIGQELSMQFDIFEDGIFQQTFTYSEIKTPGPFKISNNKLLYAENDTTGNYKVYEIIN